MGKSKGKRSETRNKLRKNVRDRGKIALKRMTQEFSEDDRVSIKIDPSIMSGQPHPRFYGKTGVIAGKQGKAYVVEVKDGGKTKKIISGSEHLEKVKE